MGGRESVKMAIFYVGIAASVSATLMERLGKVVTEKTIE